MTRVCDAIRHWHGFSTALLRCPVLWLTCAAVMLRVGYAISGADVGCATLMLVRCRVLAMLRNHLQETARGVFAFAISGIEHCGAQVTRRSKRTRGGECRESLQPRLVLSAYYLPARALPTTPDTYVPDGGSCLRACYAMPGTHPAEGA
eukprot:569890-Rhodomonas_salina.4